MGAEQSSRAKVAQQDGARKPFTGIVIGGSFMAPRPEITVQQQQVDIEHLKNMRLHKS